MPLTFLLRRGFLMPLLALLLAQGVTQKTHIDEPELGKVIRPIVAAGLEAAEDRVVAWRQIRQLGQPDRTHVEINVIVLSTTGLTVDTVRKKTTRSADTLF